MGNIDKDIRELREKTGRTRYQFLRAELQTCFTALEMVFLAAFCSVSCLEVSSQRLFIKLAL